MSKVINCSVDFSIKILNIILCPLIKKLEKQTIYSHTGLYYASIKENEKNSLFPNKKNLQHID